MNVTLCTMTPAQAPRCPPDRADDRPDADEDRADPADLDAHSAPAGLADPLDSPWADAEFEAAPADAPAPQRPGLAPAATEAQLRIWLSAVAEHDERALAALYDATLPRVYGLVLRLVRQAALAEEVAEDTYFQVWRQAVRYDPDRGQALAWLLGMARSRAIDALRREARFRHDPLDDDDGHGQAATETASGDELLAATRRHAALHQALLRLPPGPRQLVALSFFRGLSHEEIASQTQLPMGTVKSQIRRALLSLREVLGEAATPPLGQAPTPPHATPPTRPPLAA